MHVQDVQDEEQGAPEGDDTNIAEERADEDEQVGAQTGEDTRSPVRGRGRGRGRGELVQGSPHIHAATQCPVQGGVVLCMVLLLVGADA